MYHRLVHHGVIIYDMKLSTFTEIGTIHSSLIYVDVNYVVSQTRNIVHF